MYKWVVKKTILSEIYEILSIFTKYNVKFMNLKLNLKHEKS